MEPIVIEKGKGRVTFYSDRVELARKGKISHTIYYDNIEKITYNPKFGFRDFISFAFSLSYSGANCGFVMFLKDSLDPIPTRLSNEDFEKIKNIIADVPIELV